MVMKRAKVREKIRARVELLQAIKDGRKHTHANAVLAPLSQDGLITYGVHPRGWPAVDVKITDAGEAYRSFYQNLIEKGEW